MAVQATATTISLYQTKIPQYFKWQTNCLENTPCVRQAPTEVMGMNVPTESPSIWDECLRKTPCFQLPSSTTAATSLSQSIRTSRPGCLAFPPSLLFFTTRGDCSLGQGKAESVIFRQCITNLSLSTAME